MISSGKTRQGVRDLNGAGMRGSGYNGRRASCTHKPGMTISRVERDVVTGEYWVVCSVCDGRLYLEKED